jgi:ABC-2 type transport system permease protein
MSFYQLFLTNVRMVYRNRSGVFWTLAMPTIFFVVFALFRLERFINLGGQSYADFFLPGFLAYVFMQGGLYGLGYFLTDLKAKGVIKRFLVTPIKPFEMAVSVVASRVIIMLVQLVVLTVIAMLFFHTHLNWANIPLILLVTLIGGSLFLLVGLLVSTAATNYESAAPITAGIGLPLMFLGDVFYPLAMLPDFLEKIGRILPLAHLSEALRSLYSGTLNWERLGINIGAMLIWFVILLLLTRWRFKLEE